MSDHSSYKKQENNMEMQERPQTMCWPLVNGSAHHNLPPIAAITSRQPSPQLHRTHKDEHVFAAPGQLRPAPQPIARAPTPFPDLNHPQRNLGFHSPTSVSPKLATIASAPTKSAFAVVGSPYSPSVAAKEGAISSPSPVQDNPIESSSYVKCSEASIVRESLQSNSNEDMFTAARPLSNSNSVVTSSNNSYQSQNHNSAEFPKTSQPTTLVQLEGSNTNGNSQSMVPNIAEPTAELSTCNQRNSLNMQNVPKGVNSYIVPPHTTGAGVITSTASERHGHLYTSMRPHPVSHNPYQLNNNTNSNAAYYDAVAVSKQTIVPTSTAIPYKFPVPAEYSHRANGPRVSAPVPAAAAATSQYHRQPPNRPPINSNIRQAFADNRQYPGNMRQMEMHHSSAQISNYPGTHNDQHSIIKTANPLHLSSASSVNSFNSPAYYRQAASHTIVSPSDRSQPTQNRHPDLNRSHSELIAESRTQRHLVNFPTKAPHLGEVKYYNPPNANYPNATATQNYKRHEASNYPTQQQMPRATMPSTHNYAGSLGNATGQAKINPATQTPPLRPQQAPQYYQMEASKQTWNVPPNNELRTHGAVTPFTSKEMQVQSPLGAAQMHRNVTTHSHAYQSQINSRDRQPQAQPPTALPLPLPRVNPPSISSFTSQSSPRFSAYTSTTSSPHSSSYSPSLPRVNFPSPVPASFSGTSLVASRSECITTFSSKFPPNQYNEAFGKSQQLQQQPVVSHARQNTYQPAKTYQQQQPASGTFPMSYRHPQSNTHLGNRTNNADADICRNPFELPAPSIPNSIIKLNERHSSLPYNASDIKMVAANSASNYIPRSSAENYGSMDVRKKPDQMAMYMSAHNIQQQTTHTRQEQTSQRPMQPVLSARFPPVPQSNYDLNRQIYDRMTGSQQAPPRLIAKQEKIPFVPNSELLRHKRESPLDLSVKTVRQSADSTRDDVDMIVARQLMREPRLASAPKIDFNPNFAEPLVRPSSQNATFLPPVHSIRKFQQPPTKPMKRPLSESPTPAMAKIPKVDAWKVAMDEQIEERLKAARQSRLETPIQGSFPVHPNLEFTKEVNMTTQMPKSTPEHIIQQISQGVVPDSRLLQDRKVVDMLRSSLEEKEARLEALQAAARRRPPAERMCVPPSYPLPPSQAVEPIPIGVQPTHKYMRPSDPDLDGLAAFLAARIRTKAEMKQMGPTRDNLRLPDGQVTPAVPNTCPPKLLRENRSSCEQPPVALPIPRDPTGLRSSSETSVFDFRESDSENEMPVLERQTLDGMRRPRKTQPAAPTPAVESECTLAAPVPAPPPPQPEPDPAWDNACDMFLEQLQKRPIKRSVRRKKPNPKFFTNELDTPHYMKAPPTDSFAIKSEPEEDNCLPLSTPDVVVKEEIEKTVIESTPSKNVKSESSSDDELPGVTVVREGRIKLITRKQRTVASDSEWDSSVADASSVDESEASSASASSSDDNSDGQRKKAHSDSNERRTRRRRNCRSQGSDSDGAVTKRRRARRVLASDSDSQSKTKAARPRTRTHPLSESGEESNDLESSESEEGKGKAEDKLRVRTRQQTRTVRHSGRMRLRSKQLSKDGVFRPGWEDDVIKFKQQLRMPARLINVTKPKKKSGQESESPKSDKKKVSKDNKEDGEEEEEEVEKDLESSLSRCGRYGRKIVGLRGNAGLRRSNKAVSNSKRHLNKGNKRLKLRRKFRSGFDYMRKKKKSVQRKEKDGVCAVLDEAPPVTAAPPTETKRRVRSDAPDVSAEVKGWVVNKSAGETVLHRAARLGHADVAAYCLETRGMEPSPRDHAGYTPLHEACSRGHVAVAALLLQYGASVTESVRGGVRPLHQAAENNHLELVRLLLAYGADPQLETYTGQTALTLTSNQDIRELIITHLSDIHGEDSYKWTFEGPASVFDPKWAVDPLANPPSPELDSDDVELEVSRAMLPPLYRLQTANVNTPSAAESSDRWLMLTDLLSYTQMGSEQQLLSHLQMTLRTSLSQQEFLEQAKPCNILAAPKTCAQNVTLLRYDDAVRKLLDVEIAIVSAHS